MTKSSQVTVIPVYRDMLDYVAACRTTPQADRGQLWAEIVIGRRWSEWAAEQVNEGRTRSQLAHAPNDLDILADRAHRVAESDIELVIKSSYARINDALPAPIDRAVCIWVDPVLVLAEHGVVGTCVGDNILIRINPVEDDWLAWVPYVLAHESHHCYWGYQHFFVKQRTRFDFGTSLITEGEADSFATSLFPGLEIPWLNALSPVEERAQWYAMRDVLSSRDPALPDSFMFGDKAKGIPRYAGYTIGYRIVQAYLRSHPDLSPLDWTDKEPEEILAESGYDPK